MKGLLAKDFALFLQRKKIFIFLAIWAVVMCFVMEDASFVVGWMTVISAFFAISSLAYDEYDNCFPFLMSLPVSGKIYAVEKYVFGFIFGLGAWLFTSAVYFVYAAVKGSMSDFVAELAKLVIFIPACMILIDISLPIDMKLGSEKGRMMILIIWGVVFLGFFAVSKLFAGKYVVEISPDLPVVPLTFALSVVLTVLSLLISIRIMTRKEY